MSYGVALRNGIPFTLGTIAALCVNATGQAWSPASLWPTGTEAGMWIDPSNLTSQWQDSTGTTPVSTPGTVADSSNPVGLALDLRLGAPTTLGPELVVNGDFAAGGSDWEVAHGIPSCAQFIDSRLEIVAPCDFLIYQNIGPISQSKIYEVSWYQYSPGGGRFLISIGDVGWWLPTYGTGQKTFRVSPGGSGQFVAVSQGGASPGDWCDNISVREIPGNHLLQATSTARPLESARVNWVQRDSDINLQTAGYLYEATLTQTAVAPPIGTGSVYKLVGNAVAAQHRIAISPAPGAMNTAVACFTFFAKAAEVRRCYIFAGQDYGNVWFDTMSGTCGPMPEYIGRLSYSITSVGDGWYRCQMTVTTPSFSTFQLGLMADGGTTIPETGVPMDGLGMYLWGAQAEFGLVPGPYQSIVGNGSSYPSTGFPIYQHFDGTDDGMATASFAAGTLTSAMDCMIAVRRDAGGNAVAGLYNGVSDATKVFGIAESGSSSGCVGSGAGTPTVWVDGVQLTGGTAVTRGTLHTALTVGDYHVLEFRGLDLSTWTASGFGLYTSYVLNGAQGGILLFPSSTSTADRDAARTWLGAKVGLTL